MTAAAAVQAGDESLVRMLTCTDAESLLAAAVTAAVPATAPRIGLLYRLHGGAKLRLSASLGLKQELLDRYQVVATAAELPAARALRERRPVFASTMNLPRAVPATGPRPPDVAYEVAALPLFADGEMVGSLCVVLPAALHGRVAGRLTAVATVCAHRLRHLLSAGGGRLAGPAAVSGGGQLPGAVTPQDGSERTAMLDLAMSHAGIGSFHWNFASGRVVWDERMCALFGIAPEDFDGRIETFRAALHPQDRRMVEAAEEEGLQTGRYDLVYRIVLPGGPVRWIEADSRVVFDPGGRPQGVIGVAKDRTEEQERESHHEARRRLVLELSRALSAAVTTEGIVAAVHSTLPAVGASAVALYLWEEHGVRLIGSRGFDGDEQRRLRRDVAAAHGHPMLASLRGGEPLFVESRREWAELMPGSDLTPLPGRHAWALLPLSSGEGLVGLCALVFDQPHTFSPDDRTVYAAAAGTLGQALARARLFDTRRAYLTELQRLMLPHPLPEVAGLDVAVRYHPSPEGLEVGGDWYDVVPRSQRRTALVIGDVEGHNVQAAGVMGQLRTAMRAYASEGYGPAGLLELGNRALCAMDTDLLATCCIAEIDPAAGQVQVSRAGHPYPLLVDPHGRARQMEVEGGLPLGTFAGSTYPVTETVLAPGATLLLYTDGLVERPGASFEEGIAELREGLAWWGGGSPSGESDPSHRHRFDLGTVADRIAAPAASRAPHDDIAFLLARVAGD